MTSITGNNVNTFSVLSSMTPNVTMPSSTTIPLGNTQLASARLTGFLPSDGQIISSNIPVSVVQTVNTPAMIPPSPSRAVSFPVVPPSPTSRPVPVNIPPSPSVRIAPPSPSINNVIKPPSPQVNMSMNQVASSPTARSALLNLNPTATSTSSVVIPNLTAQSIRAQQTATASGQNNLFLPSIKVVNPNSSLPLKPTAEIMNQQFEVRDYQGIIANSSLENELLNAGYAPLSKIVIKADGGEKRTQYIKAINKMGQKVFIFIDVTGYTTARSTDLTLIEAHNATIVPYSLKTGAYNCAGKDVCGVAFECGSDAVCVLARAPNDLTPKESNFVFVEKHAPSAATIESEGSIMTYPVIRLSEIRANPILVLQNTDTVTRRLRNSGYTALLQELATTQQSINKLNEAFVRFNNLRESVAGKLNSTLTQLEQWNAVYMNNPPTTDEGKDKYRALQYNLALRNENIGILLRSMKKIADLHVSIDNITKEMTDITEYDEKEFINVDRAVSD